MPAPISTSADGFGDSCSIPVPACERGPVDRSDEPHRAFGHRYPRGVHEADTSTIPSRPTTAAAGGSARRSPCPSSPATTPPRCSGDTTADVVILGGGYTGLWTALPAEAPRPRHRRRRAGAGHLRRRAQRAQRRIREQLLGRSAATWPTRFGDAAAMRSVPGRGGERRGDRRLLRASTTSTLGSAPTATSSCRGLRGAGRVLGRPRHHRRPPRPRRGLRGALGRRRARTASTRRCSGAAWQDATAPPCSRPAWRAACAGS